MEKPARRWWPVVAPVSLLAAFFGAIAPAFVRRYQLPFRSAFGIYSCFVLMLILVITPGIPASREWIRERMRARSQPAILLLLWCLPYVIYAAGTHDFRSIALVRLLAVPLPILAVYTLTPVRRLDIFSWQDPIVALLLITVLLSHELTGVWNVPVNLDFLARLFLIVIGAWTWTFVRTVPRLGYDFSFSPKTFGIAALNFSLFALIAIPSSLALHFTSWNPRPRGLQAFLVDYLELFLFVALLEELFFRGFLQSLIATNFRSTRKAQVIVSCLFGFFHILHAPFPNWRYVLLATVAGWFYGSAFLKSGNLLAPTLTHAMVDTVWRTFFSKS